MRVIVQPDSILLAPTATSLVRKVVRMASYPYTCQRPYALSYPRSPVHAGTCRPYVFRNKHP